MVPAFYFNLPNTDLQWEQDSKATHGYYLTVEKLNNRGSYPIKCTITSSPSETWTDIYGLREGDYIIYINSIGNNYELLDSHTTMLMHTDYNGGTRISEFK